MTSKELILKRLQESSQPLAVHEFYIMGLNENNIATRLSELAKEGIVQGNFRKGKSFKEWSLLKNKNVNFKFEGNGQMVFE